MPRKTGSGVDRITRPFTQTRLHLDMGTIVPAISGPEASAGLCGADRCQGRLHARDGRHLQAPHGQRGRCRRARIIRWNRAKVVIASITSCTNTSNPYVMIGAGLVARKAASSGAEPQALGQDLSRAGQSQVVSAYLEAAGLQDDLDAIGFNLVGYGCTTCIGNSGPIQAELSKAIAEGDLVATSVLSGNRNFEGTYQPRCARQLPCLAASWSLSMPLPVPWTLT